jgi:hypothetical protein
MVRKAADSNVNLKAAAELKAPERGYEAVVKELLETHEVNINMAGQFGRTPLWVAA